MSRWPVFTTLTASRCIPGLTSIYVKKKKNHSLVRKRGSPHLKGSPHLTQTVLLLSALNSKEAKLFACNQQTPQICGFLLGLVNGKDPQQTGKIVYVGEGGSLAPCRLPSGYPISGSQPQVEPSYLCARGAVPRHSLATVPWAPTLHSAHSPVIHFRP